MHSSILRKMLKNKRKKLLQNVLTLPCVMLKNDKLQDFQSEFGHFSTLRMKGVKGTSAYVTHFCL